MGSQKKTTKILIFTALVLIFAFVFTPVVSARYKMELYPTMPQVRGEQTATPSAEADNGKAKGPKQKVRDKLENRLAEVKLKVCEKKESNITKRSTKLVAKADLIQSRFDKIVNKVDAFYIDKVLANGREVEDYDSMLSNIEDKRREVAAVVGVAESTAENFDCEGQNPKQQIKQFRSDMKGVIVALKDYKKAVIDYLVAVKTKGKNIKTEAATESAKPATPSAGQ